MGDDDILLFPLISSHSSSSYYGVYPWFWRAVGRFADTIDSRNEEGGVAGGLHRGPMSPMNSASSVVKFISTRAISCKIDTNTR